MRKYYLITGALVLITSCTITNIFQPTEKNLSVMQQKVPGITMEKLNEGMNIYKSHCASCHWLYAPSEHTQAKWEKILHEMFPKAKIADETIQQNIRNYLYAMSK